MTGDLTDSEATHEPSTWLREAVEISKAAWATVDLPTFDPPRCLIVPIGGHGETQCDRCGVPYAPGAPRYVGEVDVTPILSLAYRLCASCAAREYPGEVVAPPARFMPGEGHTA